MVSRLPSRGGESGEGDSGSVQTVEESLVVKKDERADVGLELSLGFEPICESWRRFEGWGRDERFIGRHV